MTARYAPSRHQVSTANSTRIYTDMTVMCHPMWRIAMHFPVSGRRLSDSGGFNSEQEAFKGKIEVGIAASLS